MLCFLVALTLLSVALAGDIPIQDCGACPKYLFLKLICFPLKNWCHILFGLNLLKQVQVPPLRESFLTAVMSFPVLFIMEPQPLARYCHQCHLNHHHLHHLNHHLHHHLHHRSPAVHDGDSADLLIDLLHLWCDCWRNWVAVQRLPQECLRTHVRRWNPFFFYNISLPAEHIKRKHSFDHMPEIAIFL